jgi:DNA-binding GntR family transcriptional regulator
MTSGPTLRQRVTDHLTDAILDQHLRPGEHIVAEDLAHALGVSRLPVREALRDLAGRGLVELRPRRGAFVTEIDLDTPDELVETFDVRALLEPTAAALAAERRTPEQLAAYDALIAAGQDAVGAGSRVAVNRAHHRTLRAIATMAAHPIMDAALLPLHHRTLLAFAGLALAVEPAEWDVHRAVRDAVATRDAETAARLTRDHLHEVRDAFRRGLPTPIGHRSRGR